MNVATKIRRGRHFGTKIQKEEKGRKKEKKIVYNNFSEQHSKKWGEKLLVTFHVIKNGAGLHVSIQSQIC